MHAHGSILWIYFGNVYFHFFAQLKCVDNSSKCFDLIWFHSFRPCLMHIWSVEWIFLHRLLLRNTFQVFMHILCTLNCHLQMKQLFKNTFDINKQKWNETKTKSFIKSPMFCEIYTRLFTTRWGLYDVYICDATFTKWIIFKILLNERNLANFVTCWMAYKKKCMRIIDCIKIIFNFITVNVS